MIFRPARHSDLNAIVSLAVESVSQNPLPVKIDQLAMKEMAESLINPAHFIWVTEVDGNVVAAVAAQAGKSFWYRGLQVSVLLYYSRYPRAGLPLLREFAQWCKGRSGVKVAVIELEPTTDPRLLKFMRRLGFTRESANLCYVRQPNV